MDGSATPTDNITLINGMMQRFAGSGDAVDGLRWALPHVLRALDAEAGSLFLHRPEEDVLECVVCVGPVDVTGLKVPRDKGLVGRAFSEGRTELVADATNDGGHFQAPDDATGFRTLSTATAPVHLGSRHFGAIQAINRRVDGGVGNFRQADLPLLEMLAGSLALAMSNVELTQAVIDDSLLRRDLELAREAQIAMMPPADPMGMAAGRVLPARELAGDFFDYARIGDRLAFCQGDVAGKGMAAALMMARTITLFRRLARQEMALPELVATINDELVAVRSERFVTFVVGWLDCVSGTANIVNCGHGPMMIVDQEDGAVRRFNAQIPPLGITSLYNLAVEPTRHDLRASFLCLATDGVTEARAAGRELGLNGLAGLLGRIKAKGAEERVDAVMRLFEAGKLTTHDDATLLIVTAAGLASS
jgi:sigma-B regulation protein RsbU (phosphoserine phosphatase)